MTLEQYAYLAEIVGVILIIASLVYVARQLRQNTNAQLATSRQAMLAADLDLLSKSMDYPEASLGMGQSPEEVRLTSFLISFLRIREFAWYQVQNGILDQTTFESYMAPTGAVFASDEARKIWSSDIIRIDSDFRALVDGLINNPEGEQ